MPRLFGVAAAVTGHRELIAELELRARHAMRERGTDVLVGYETPYALRVHESVGMVMQGKPRPSPRQGFFWDPQGQAQAKYLEEPSRTHLRQMARIAVLTSIRLRFVYHGFGFIGILSAVGRYLLRVSQKMVPVETGTLKASGKLEYHRRR